MNAELENLVAEFLLSGIPTPVLDAYKIVAELKYSIDDKHSLSVQLDELAKQLKEPPDKDTFALDLVRSAFDVGDFPIKSAQGGLEKFHRKLSGLSAFDLPGHHEQPFRPDPGDRGEAPDTIFDDYKRLLSDPDGCAAGCAALHHNWALARGSNPYDALQRGLDEGKECQRTGFCRAFPGERRGRPLFYCSPGFRLPPPFLPEGRFRP